MQRKFIHLFIVVIILLTSCTKKEEKHSFVDKTNNYKKTIYNKYSTQKTNIIYNNKININNVKIKIKEYDELWDLLTTGGINNPNLSKDEKKIRMASFDIYNKVINASNFFALQYDEHFLSQTNRILNDQEIKLLIENLDKPALIKRAGNLYLGNKMIRDVYAAKKILEYVIKNSDDTACLYAMRKLAEFTTLPYDRNRDLLKAIELYKNTIKFLKNKNCNIENLDYALNVGWINVGLAQCYNALGQYDKEQKVYDRLGDYLRESLNKTEKQIDLSVSFAKNLVIYRERLPQTLDGLNKLTLKFENILNEIDDKNNNPLARKCKGLIKELKRKSKIIKNKL